MKGHAIDWESNEEQFHYKSFRTLDRINESVFLGSQSNLLALEIISHQTSYRFQKLMVPKLEHCLKHESCMGKIATILTLLLDFNPHHHTKYQNELNKLFSLLRYHYNEHRWPSDDTKLFTSLQGLYLAQHCNIDGEFSELRRYLTNQLMDHTQQIYGMQENRAAFLYSFAKLIEMFPFLGFQWGLELRRTFQSYNMTMIKPIDLCLMIQGKNLLGMDIQKELKLLKALLQDFDFLVENDPIENEHNILFLAVSSPLLD